jgi:molybdopterin converting factor small subunit
VTVTFELYGVARARAGTDRIHVQGKTLGEALSGLASLCPALVGNVVEDGHLGSHFRLSVNGRRFTSDPARVLAEGDTLIVLSSAAGG